MASKTREASGEPATRHSAQSNGQMDFRKLEKEINTRSGAHDVFALISSHPETNPSPMRKDHQPVQPWVKVQQTTFTKWVNSHLKDTVREVTDLQDDMKDGLVLIHLMEALTDKSVNVRYQKKPRTRFQQVENMKIAFDFMEEHRVELVSISPVDIVDGNLKLILGLIWTLISKYQIASNHSGITPRESTPRKTLLRWFQTVLADKSVTNFSSDWNDGRNLAALVDLCKPGLIPDHASLDPSNGLENVTHAMSVAEEHFGIPQVILPQDLASEHPDEPSVMTYLSFFCCHGSPGHTLLLNWINSVVPQHAVTNFTSDWRDGEALCALVQAFLPHFLPSSTTPLDKVQSAMAVAADKLEVEQTLTPQEFINPDLGQMFMMVYLTQFMCSGRIPPSSPSLSAVGPGISGGTTGTDTPFSIRGKVASDNDLTITITSPEGSVVDFSNVPSPSGEPTFQYTPEIPGTYVIDVTCSGEHIPGSPYMVTHTGSSQVTHTGSSHPQNCSMSGKALRRACIGAPATFTVDTSSAGGGKLEVEVHDPNSEEMPATVEAKDGGLYEVCFTPQKVGEYWVFVSWGGEDIPGSPFTCKVFDPFACAATGNGLSGGVLGQTSTFEVATHGAGPGKLSATVYGPSEPVDLTQESIENGTYVYTYTPEQVGSYIVEIKWEGFPIPGSPFTAQPSSESETGGCFVKEMHSGPMRVNKPVNLVVDSSAVPGSSLQAIVRSPSSEEECEMVKVEEGVYGVMFTPRAVGQYTVNILCNGAPIEDSPLDFSINDPSKCKVNVYYGSFQVDSPITFTVTTLAAGKGELEAIANGPEDDQDCTIEEEGNGKHKVSFTPRTPGAYIADLFFDGEPFLASPLEFKVCVREDKCVFEAVQRQEEAPLGELVDYFLRKESTQQEESIIVTKPDTIKGVCLLDTVHEFRMFAPGRKPEGFQAQAVGVNTRTIPSVTIVPTGDNTYSIQFMATQSDDYTVDVTYENTHVPGSPITLKLRPPADPDKVFAFDPVKPLKAKGNPIQLIFDVSQAGMGSLVANVLSSTDEQVPTTMEEIQPNVYRVTFVPTKSDRYTATVLWEGEPIRGSPFAVKYEEQHTEPMVSVGFEPDMVDGVKGQLAARCSGQSVGPVKLLVQQFETGRYQLSFDPSTKDIYQLEVHWFGKEIDGSPFEINLVDPPNPPSKPVPGPEQLVNSVAITKESQQGVLSACVLGKKSGVVPIDVSLSQDQDRAEIAFSDRLRDTFDLFVFWNHELLNGAPFKLDHNARHASQ